MTMTTNNWISLHSILNFSFLFSLPVSVTEIGLWCPAPEAILIHQKCLISPPLPLYQRAQTTCSSWATILLFCTESFLYLKPEVRILLFFHLNCGCNFSEWALDWVEMRSIPDHSRSDWNKTEQITLNCVINGRGKGQVLCLLF